MQGRLLQTDSVCLNSLGKQKANMDVMKGIIWIWKLYFHYKDWGIGVDSEVLDIKARQQYTTHYTGSKNSP